MVVVGSCDVIIELGDVDVDDEMGVWVLLVEIKISACGFAQLFRQIRFFDTIGTAS